MSIQNNIQQELSWRGLLQDISDPEIFSKLKPGDSYYVGFDPTAKSLQVGNLVQLLVAIRLTKFGLKPILLFGGATGMIGDPGGRSSERNLMSLEEVAVNVETQAEQAKQLWIRAGCTLTPLVTNNLEWTHGVSALEFLRDIGKHFTVNYMLQKESVKTRLSGDGISYTEFSYMLLQAFDFLHLYKKHGCKLQFGGSDQWGNITAGLELIRRKVQGEAFAFSVPLITNSSGQKFGKSAGNAVWLDPKLTSPYQFHQFWLNVQDSEVVNLIKVFTFAEPAEVNRFEKLSVEAPEQREAQRFLADTICTLVHGEAATEDAKRAATVLFGGSIDGLSDEQLLEIFKEAPTTEIATEEVSSLDLLSIVARTVAASKGEGRRLIQGGGIYLDNERMGDPMLKMSETNLARRGFVILRSGKKSYHLVKVRV
jgi:tyrosyl-tRNA synthetase